MDMTFEEAVFEGLASDGGLLVPHFLPDVSGKYKEVAPHSIVTSMPTAHLITLTCVWRMATFVLACTELWGS